MILQSPGTWLSIIQVPNLLILSADRPVSDFLFLPPAVRYSGSTASPTSHNGELGQELPKGDRFLVGVPITHFWQFLGPNLDSTNYFLHSDTCSVQETASQPTKSSPLPSPRM
jgi:hypothetical protein